MDTRICADIHMESYSSGVGFAAIQRLARHGAKVYMGARDEKKARAAIQRLHAEGLGPGNGEVVWLSLDLSDPRKVVAAAEEFMQGEERLDVLGGYQHLDCGWSID